MRLNVVLACAVAALAPSRALAWPARPATFPAGGALIGEASIAPGLIARYEYHYNRNALRDSRHAGAFLVALTEAGNVVSFAGDASRPIAELVDPVPATSLGQDDAGAVLVGYGDGRLVRVNASTLSFTQVAKLPGEIAWIGYRQSPRGAVVLVKQTPSYAEVHDLASRRVHAVKDLPAALLLDSKGRLWMGADHGEWGGWCRVLDLESGATRALAMPGGGAPDNERWQGVHGFVELSDGEVWAYGGLSHMGFNEGYVVRVVDEPRRLATFSSPKRSGKRRPNEPQGPITFVARDPLGQGVLVFSYSDIYRSDRQLRRWQKLHSLRIRYRFGRPDAVGSYPSVQALHLLDDRTMLVATRLDGYVRVRSGIEKGLALAGQLGARSVDRIASSREGQIFIEEYRSDTAWRLEHGAWRETSFSPPFAPHPLEPRTIPPTNDWYETKLLVGPAREVVTVNKSAMRTVTTAAWRGGRAAVLGRQLTDLFLPGTFVTPDDGLWNVWYGEIWRFANGSWITVGKYEASPPGSTGIDAGRGPRALPGGPPWILLAPDRGQLLTLTPASGPAGARLAQRELKDSVGKQRRVSDAIPWGPGQLLLATDGGLAVYALASGRLTEASIPKPSRPVTRLCVDRQHRLWLGGDGVWVVDGRGGLRSLEALPMISGSKVETIAADDPDGVLVSLGERGVVRLRLAAR